ncbi:MAG: hypothetical protein K2N71_05380 [Oscillospiraceae bacterium]|nr:hypothetical protein [Oscillospiraceae bacterium]
MEVGFEVKENLMIEFAIFGAIFIIIGIALVIDYIRHNAEIKNSREINATIVDFVEKKRSTQGDGTFHMIYAPVYEYYDGEVKRFTSPVSSTGQVQLGTEVTLYISESGKVSERRSVVITLIMGIIFAAVGAVFVVLALV